jgi:hypothetical protein
MRAFPRAQVLFGTAAGVVAYGVTLAVHLALAGEGLRPFPSCCEDPASSALNTPARALAALVAIDAVAPQRFGKIDGGTVERVEARWSPAGFVAVGASGYALLGGLVGAAIGALRLAAWKAER